MVNAPTIAGDTGGAGQFVQAIEHALEYTALSLPERRKLYKLRKRWRNRATGVDLRWLVHGSKPGRPAHPRAQVVHPNELNGKYNPEQDDPLLKSIIEKYGSQGDR